MQTNQKMQGSDIVENSNEVQRPRLVNSATLELETS